MVFCQYAIFSKPGGAYTSMCHKGHLWIYVSHSPLRTACLSAGARPPPRAPVLTTAPPSLHLREGQQDPFIPDE